VRFYGRPAGHERRHVSHRVQPQQQPAHHQGRRCSRRRGIRLSHSGPGLRRARHGSACFRLRGKRLLSCEDTARGRQRTPQSSVEPTGAPPPDSRANARRSPSAGGEIACGARQGPGPPPIPDPLIAPPTKGEDMRANMIRISMLAIGLAATPAILAAQDNSIAGVWNVTVTVKNCQTNALITTVHSLQMFLRDGSMIETANTASRGISVGAWTHAEGQTYQGAFSFFRYKPDGTFGG